MFGTCWVASNLVPDPVSTPSLEGGLSPTHHSKGCPSSPSPPPLSDTRM